MTEPLILLTEDLEEITTSVDQIDVRNITEADVDLYDPPQVCGIETTDVENISAGTDAVENPAITEKLGKSPRIEYYVDTVWRAGSSCVEIPRKGCTIMSEAQENGVELIKDLKEPKMEQILVEQFNPAYYKEEVRGSIVVQTQHHSCDIPKHRVDECVQSLSKVETSEDVDKEASIGVKSTFQMLTQDDTVISKFDNIYE